MKLEVQGLGVTYTMRSTGRPLRAIEGLTFGIDRRTFLTIVGPSGCGKTTLLKVIAGLIQPSTGEIRLDGHPLHEPGHDRAMVFQVPALLPWRTVLANVGYGLELQGADDRLVDQRAREHLRLVGLSGFEQSYPAELSQGMQQRVNLARALATEPELLLLDEPFASLDSQTRLFMQLELQSIWERTRAAALFVTHQITEAILLGDQVLVLSARPGRIKEVVSIGLPRPRTLAMKRSVEFNQLEEHIWDLVGEEVTAIGHFPDFAGQVEAGNPA